MMSPFQRRALGVLFVFAISVLSEAAQACADFSGHFQSSLEDGTELDLKAVQKGCEQIAMQYDYSDGTSFSKVMIFDGKKRVIFDEPRFKTIEAFWVSDVELRFAAELYNKTSGSVNTLQGNFRLDDEGNLVENKTIYSLKGKPLLTIGVIHIRIK